MAAETQGEDRKIGWKLVAETTDPRVVRELAARETRGWGGLLLFLGVTNLLRAAGSNEIDFDPAWVVLLILVGGFSYYFRSAVMLAVGGVLFAWAALSNLSTGSWPWMVVAAVQAGLAFFIFRSFALIRRAARRLSTGLGYGAPGRPDRAAVVLPWTGCALTAVGGAGLFALVVTFAVWAVTGGQNLSDQAIERTIEVLLDLVIFGLALAAASLLAGYRFRVVSILAVVGAVLTLAGMLLLALIGQAS